MRVNALRSHLAEFGIVVANGAGRVDDLLELAEQDTTLPLAATAAVKVVAEVLHGLAKAIGALATKIAEAHPQNETSRLLAGVPGIGKLIAAAIAATVPDPHTGSTPGATLPPGLASPRGRTRAAASRRSRPSPSRATDR